VDRNKIFEIFSKQDLVYFDNSASTLKPKSVCYAMDFYNRFESANSGRGVYSLAHEVTTKVENTRQKVALFLEAQTDEIVFVKNTTEAINLACFAYLEHILQPGDQIVLSQVEHNSNYLPFVVLANKKGAQIVDVALDEHGKITLENAIKAITNKTRFVALHLVSNTLGDKVDLKPIIAHAHKMGAKVLVDASQAVAHMKIDVKELDCDFLAFSGYKVFGPTGVGVLFGKKHLLEQATPIMFGGGMMTDFVNNQIFYAPVPQKFEAGTLPIASIIGLGAAIDFVFDIGYEHIEKTEQQLKDYLLQKLSKIEHVEIYSHQPDFPIVIFNIKNVHAHDAATMYDQFNVCVRAGNHCASMVNKWFSQIASLRISLAFYNTFEDIDKFVFATEQIAKFWNR
jgi:cysteine desulfurase/selenocysteine lyase